MGLGELLACYLLGSLLLSALPRISFFRTLIPADRLDRLAAHACISFSPYRAGRVDVRRFGTRTLRVLFSFLKQ